MTIFSSSPVSVDLAAVIGTYYDPADLSWMIPNAIIDLDYENGRYAWNGVRYPSIAAIVAAGHGSITNGIARITLPAALPGTHTLYGKGTAPAASAVTKFLAALDDGADGVPSDELEFIGLDAANLAAASSTRASTLTVNCTGASGGNIATGGAVKIAMRVTGAPSTSGMSVNGAAVRLTLTGSGLAAVATQLVVGNREDETRPWGGAVKRVALINGALNDAALVSLTTP